MVIRGAELARWVDLVEIDTAPLTFDADAIAQTCRRHGVRRLSLFGSQLKGTARPDSDVDLLVESLPGSRTTLLDMAQIEIELSQVLGAWRKCSMSPDDRRRVHHMVDAAELKAHLSAAQRLTS